MTAYRYHLVQFVRRRPHLAFALALGTVAMLLPLGEFLDCEPYRCFLVGWNVATWTYLTSIV